MLTYSAATLFPLLGGVNFHCLLEAYKNGGSLEMSALRGLNDSEYSSSESDSEGYSEEYL